MHRDTQTTGEVIYTLGNLVKVAFKGDVVQGEIGYIQLENEKLKCEVIEIDSGVAKMQVFESTRGIKKGTPVFFTNELLEIELGPGLLGVIFDGLQNPLQDVADNSGIYLERGLYLEALNRTQKWEFKQVAKIGDTLTRGSTIGQVPESHFTHNIMLPFSFYGTYTLTWMIEPGSYVVDEVIAVVENEHGTKFEITMIQKWPVKFPLLEGERVNGTDPLYTGMRVIDTVISIRKGASACNPGPFGAGKTVTQQTISKYSNVDIVVLTACGERAGEVVETLKTFPTLMDVHRKQPLMKRTCIICNTSSMPVAAREASVYVGVTIAEYYRQMGLDVLLLADSTSRWAQAMREMSGRIEEIPGEEAFPAYLASRIASFYERAGCIEVEEGSIGSVTILGAVSPAGGNMSEPVTQATMNVVGCFICLSREFSDQRRYPAIDPALSWSKYIDITANAIKSDVPQWGDWVMRCRKLIVAGDEIGRKMEVVGQEGTSMADIITYLQAELFSFCYLQQNAFEPEDAYCSIEQQKVQFKLMNYIFDIPYEFKDADEAKTYFLKLQNKVKNINFLKFESDPYTSELGEIYKELEAVVEKIGKEKGAGV